VRGLTWIDQDRQGRHLAMDTGANLVILPIVGSARAAAAAHGAGWV
jgi:hypothetical protein